MSKVLNMVFVLIFLLIVVAYFRGSIAVVGSLGENINGLINTLQGKNSNGEFSKYPV
jgi:uncharacterized membrane protein